MKKNYLFIGLCALILGAGAWWWSAGGARPGRGGADPLAGIVIPEQLARDADTRQRVQQEIDGTMAMFERAPDSWNTWIAIGNLRSFVLDFDGAIAAYQRAVDIQPNNILGYRNIANVYATNLRDFSRASAYYRLAIKNNPQDADGYLELGALWRRQLKNPAEAEAVYVSALSPTQNYPDILVALIELYKETKQTDKERATAKKLLTLYPDNDGYRNAYGRDVQ